jgi:hypothetical protein
VNSSYVALMHSNNPRLHLSSVFKFTFLEVRVEKALKKGKAVPLHAMEALEGERRYSSYSFSTSALDVGELSASRPGRAFPPRKGPPGTHCTEGWVRLRAGLDTEVRGKILCPCRGSNPDQPVIQSIVRHYTD